MQVKQALFIAVSAISAFVAGCSPTDSEGGEYSKWSFSGTVVDATNNLGIGGAAVSYQNSSGNLKTTETDESGNFFIDDLPYGARTFTFTYKEARKKDTLYYAPHVETINSTSESSHMEGVVATSSKVIRLYPLNASVKGEFFLYDNVSKKPVPAKGAGITIIPQSADYVNLFPDSFEATSDSLGKFSFKGLPADSGLSIMVAPLSYKGLRYTFANKELPRLKSNGTTDLGRLYFEQDTLVKKDNDVTASNVMDDNYLGYKGLSPLIVPYYVFKEKISSSNLSVTVRSDSASFYVDPKVKGDTLFLTHADSAFAAETRYTVEITAYGKESGDRYGLVLGGDSSFTIGRGLYAVASNAWPDNEKFRTSFGTSDTLWIKFSENLVPDADKVQWSYAPNAARTIYAHSYGKNADAWVKKDTLFVQMMERMLDSRSQGDTIGLNITAYSQSGLVLRNFILYTEIQIPGKVRIKASNVADKSLTGYKDVSPLVTPFYVFEEEISDDNLSVSVKADSEVFYVTPAVKKDTLFLKHDLSFPPESRISVSIAAYGKKSGTRMAYELSGDSAFVTGRGLYAVTSNVWPSNKGYKANFSIEDTIWVKFSKPLSTNTDRIQWSKANDAKYTLYGHGANQNAEARVKGDTLFITMLPSAIRDTTKNGDSFGANLTVYASDETYLKGFTLYTEFEIPEASSSSSTQSSSSQASSSSSESASDDE